ncbi:hypothetical protein BOO86_15925 [Mycobacterium sp. CBMA 234]|uniref:hypothetical protein n=1 Tax=Mycolicibacterium sp. CBMA 234 TaxID=1918495 RepID=UPI0012DFE583|nr:hypothetical protein [Mycolicibacterium sp. CBMA 234]MUL65965.1 hypothetical protein [Mycolicibacterium sp. CBMA 234]
MIKYEWRTELTPAEADELADMLRRAAEFDAEPEYSTIDFADVYRTLGTPRVRQLVIWMLPRATVMGEPDQPECIAGLLRLNVAADGSAEAAVVIDPRLRSIGIMTLLFERIGLDIEAAEGWAGTGVRSVTAWARGNHPAAGRLSNRFLIPRTRRVWKLIRSTSENLSAAPVLEPIGISALDELSWTPAVNGTAQTYALREDGRITGVAAVDPTPVTSEEFGHCATVLWAVITPNSPVSTRRQLLAGTAAVVHEQHFTGLICHVDSNDATMVNACRLAEFQHDRTDAYFQLGGQS